MEWQCEVIIQQRHSRTGWQHAILQGSSDKCDKAITELMERGAGFTIVDEIMTYILPSPLLQPLVDELSRKYGLTVCL